MLGYDLMVIRTVYVHVTNRYNSNKHSAIISGGVDAIQAPLFVI